MLELTPLGTSNVLITPKPSAAFNYPNQEQQTEESNKKKKVKIHQQKLNVEKKSQCEKKNWNISLSCSQVSKGQQQINVIFISSAGFSPFPRKRGFLEGMGSFPSGIWEGFSPG